MVPFRKLFIRATIILAFAAVSSCGTSGPSITSVTPPSGSAGTVVTIAGTNFDPTAANNAVSFNGTTAVVASATTTEIVTTVPTGATTGPVTVAANGETATSSATFIVGPTITGLLPSSGAIGQTVTITGTNFDITATVTFGSIAATSVIVTGTTQITANVPAGVATGPVAVIVTVSGQTATAPTNFTVI